MQHWTTERVLEFLQSKNLSCFVEDFRVHCVDGAELVEIATLADLQEITKLGRNSQKKKCSH
jgi:hypothetical protein